MLLDASERVIYHAHLFCGIGGGAIGFNRGSARVGRLRGRFQCAGGIDVDPAACRDFERHVGVAATCIDLFSREQYTAFHGHEPAAGWREAAPSDIANAFTARPHVVFLSAPCKGFSGLLSERASASARYQALNGLTLRGIWLMLEAFKSDPVEMIVFENVPRIMTRGRHLLDRIVALLRSYGYAVRETTHDCGELGALGQSRKRFLLVARHEEKVPPFLYEPEKHPLRGVGEIIGKLPFPLTGAGGPMHRMPALQWKTWVRLAFVRAGADWRSLNDLAVENGVLRDFGIVPTAEWHRGALGVTAWEDPAGVVTANGRPASGAFSVADPRAGILVSADRPAYGVSAWEQTGAAVTSARSPGQGRFSVADPRVSGTQVRRTRLGVRDWTSPSGTIGGESLPSNGAFSVADPRVDGHEKSVQLGVRRWEQPAGVVTGKMFVGGGPHAVADPRINGKRYNTTFRVVGWGDTSPAVAGPGGPAGGLGVADVRFSNWHPGASSSKLRVTPWGESARAVTGSQQVASGAGAVADPRPTFTLGGRDAYVTAGNYGIVQWEQPAYVVSAHGRHDNGFGSVADPRVSQNSASDDADKRDILPAARDRLVCVILALDNTWHRPFTTLELAALQGLVDPEEQFELDGLSDAAWRERIGNCVPPPSAEAIAGVIGETLLLAWSGQTFTLSNSPIWVRNVAAALSVRPDGDVTEEYDTE